ncbi:TonB-dependent receptor [Terriglobus saanensis]|uniref:TonB-dependent receptor n=1 Tax=Terriglobus saanensis (strain ATCC BAA-1853 / DSM 23119 / SP1PR4) TaxID=401053 RepID=E8UX66_TERSS|nr:TonB-dependent receptor [Terriglobus saanensis]ADV83029.1 TonB-dependent receptor [Terriglobus saanensis SP1PR4]
MKKLLLLLLLASMPLFGQTDRATITGTVTDTTGGRVPSVEITLVSKATGISRLAKTNSEGVFTISSLAVGTYKATFRADNFATQEVEEIRLDVGQTYTLPVKLGVTKVETAIDVSAGVTGLDQSSAEIGGVVHGSQAQDLPLNGRNYVSLVALVPGAIDSGTGTQDQVRFAGLSAEDNSWHLDGIDNSGINHQYQKVAIRLQPSTEAIAEFRANSAVYSADQGGTPGGQIELVSRSGSNGFHASAWEFLRNTYFDATPWGTVGTFPTLHLNNFGANLGGPVLKDKLFFFVNWESLRQVQNLSLTGTVPSASFRAAVLAKSPALAPILNAYPVGTVTIAGNANAVSWYGSGPSTDREDSGLARVDYHVNNRTDAFVRYSTDHYAVQTPADLTGQGFTTLTTPNIVIGAQTAFSSTFMNNVRFGFNRAEFTQGETNTLPYSVVVTGAFTKLDDATGSVRYDNSFTFVDDATLVRGRSTIKAGVTVRRIQENKSSPSVPDEIYTFASTTNFQNNLMDSDSYAGTVPLTGQRMTESFGYIQDQFQLSPQLTINAGMRYEYFGVDHEVQGRGIIVDPLNCSAVVCPAGSEWYHPNLLDFSPRLSVAYSPAALRGKSVLRAGYGIYYGDGQFGNLGTPVGNLATKYSITQQQAPGLSFPVTPYLGAAANSFAPSGSPINRKDTAVEEWTLSFQSEVAKQTVAQIAYFGTHASHVFSDVTLNGIDPTTGKRPFAGYSTIDYRGSSNDANTQAFQAGLRRDFASGLLISANYELSHSLDNGGIGGGEADIPQDYNCHRCEYSSSDQDMRHYFSASTIWKLPVGRGHTFLGNASHLEEFFLGGWQASGIGTARSGLPINVTISRSTSALPDQLNKNQRPNLVPGVSVYAAHKTPTSWLNPAAFSAPLAGVHGNAGRNIARAPGLWQFDTSLQKRFPVTERVGVSFRAEAFNLFNVAHYGTPASVFAGSNFGVVTTPFSTNAVGTGTPRELQFMLRADF